MSTAVVLQHRSSNLFIGQASQWVARIEEALTFGTTFEAEVFRHRHNISNADYYFIEIPDVQKCRHSAAG